MKRIQWLMLFLALVVGAIGGATCAWHIARRGTAPTPVDPALVKPFYEKGASVSLGAALSIEPKPTFGMPDFNGLDFYAMDGAPPEGSLSKYTGAIVGVDKRNPSDLAAYPQQPGHRGPEIIIHLEEGQLLSIEGYSRSCRRIFVGGQLAFYEEFNFNNGYRDGGSPGRMCQLDRDGNVTQISRWEQFLISTDPPWNVKTQEWEHHVGSRNDIYFSRGRPILDIDTASDGQLKRLSVRFDDKIETIEFGPDAKVRKRYEQGNSVYKEWCKAWQRMQKASKPNSPQP